MSHMRVISVRDMNVSIVNESEREGSRPAQMDVRSIFASLMSRLGAHQGSRTTRIGDHVTAEEAGAGM